MTLDNINANFNNRDSFLYHAVYYGLRRRDRSLSYGLLAMTIGRLKDMGLWDEYMEFDYALKRAFGKIETALNNVIKKYELKYGR
jgi:hypothetical protein